MITDYSQHRPGISIQQLLAADTTGSAPEMASCIVGPKCFLNRYGREDIPGSAFNSAGQSLTFQKLVDEIAEALDLEAFTVDLDTLRLYGVGLEARLATFTAAGSPSFVLTDLSSPNIIKISTGHVKGGSLSATFYGRPVQVGDTVVCEGISGGTIYKRKVVGLSGVVAAGTKGSNTAGDNGEAANASSNPVNSSKSATQTSAPAGWTVSCAAPEDFNGLDRGAKNLTQYGEEFIITVHTAGAPATATVNIASASGLYNATNVATTDSSGDFLITDTDAGGELAGVDIVLSKSAATLAVGQSFRILIVGDYARLTTSQITLAGTYTGTRDTTYMIQVTGTNSSGPGPGADFDDATVTITDTAGIDTPIEDFVVVDGTAFAVGAFGITFEFDGTVPAQGGLRKGDIYYVHAKAGVVSTTNFDTIILDGPAVDTLVFTNIATELYSVDFRLEFTGAIASDAHSGGTAWEATSAGMTVEAALDHYIEDRSSGHEWCPFVTTVGELSPSYRAFYATADTDTLVAIAAASDIVANAGTVDLDNPLGFAAQQAFFGSNGKTIYVLNTGGTSTEQFETALGLIENTRVPYDIMILSDSTDVWDAAKAHAVGASSAENLSFRRVRFGVDSPGEYVVLDAQADTTNFTCTISPHGGGNKLVTISAGSSESLLTTRGLVAGDLLKLTAAGTEYPIASILSDYELLLSSGPSSAVSPAVACTIWKADTVASQKAWLIARAVALAERRCSLVWVERGMGLVDGVLTVIPAQYGAAYLSGLRSDLMPQIGTTRQLVPTYSSAPRMYSRYSRQDLDEIAAAGVQILEQEHAGAPVRVRHQATTDTSNGILNYEESTTVRFDYLSFLINNRMDSTIGRVNTTEAAVEGVRAELLSVLNNARLVPVGADYGPLVDDFSSFSVARSTAFLDRIEATANVEFGPPVNRLAVVLTGYGQLPAAV